MTDPSGREIMWRRIMDDLSFEHAQLRPTAAGPELRGVVLIAEVGALAASTRSRRRHHVDLGVTPSTNA